MLKKPILHHLQHVLRKGDGYLFRLVDSNKQPFLAELKHDSAYIIKKLAVDSELPIKVTLILAVLKNEHFAYALQKLTELGVYRIVPYRAKRSVVKINDEAHKAEHYRKIITEAAEQSLRTSVPELCPFADLATLNTYRSAQNYFAYVREEANYLDYSRLDSSVTCLIGPEGGFTSEEAQAFSALGFKAVSLGKRILRAETAAIYLMSNIAGAKEK